MLYSLYSLFVQKCGGGNFPFPISSGNDDDDKDRGPWRRNSRPMPHQSLLWDCSAAIGWQGNSTLGNMYGIVKFLIRRIWRHEEVAHVVRFDRSGGAKDEWKEGRHRHCVQVDELYSFQRQEGEDGEKILKGLYVGWVGKRSRKLRAFEGAP